jgi:hypothetical protein
MSHNVPQCNDVQDTSTVKVSHKVSHKCPTICGTTDSSACPHPMLKRHGRNRIKFVQYRADSEFLTLLPQLAKLAPDFGNVQCESNVDAVVDLISFAVELPLAQVDVHVLRALKLVVYDGDMVFVEVEVLQVAVQFLRVKIVQGKVDQVINRFDTSPSQFSFLCFEDLRQSLYCSFPYRDGLPSFFWHVFSDMITVDEPYGLVLLDESMTTVMLI